MTEFECTLKEKVFLIVDDEELLRELIVLELTELGVKCIEASSGVEAFDYVKENSIDFVISDIRMPGGSGIDLLKNIQEAGLKKQIPIIMMSGFSDLSLEQAQDLGAITVVNKPFIFREVLPLIVKILSR